jgi:selenocysteine-specific elongation factor
VLLLVVAADDGVMPQTLEHLQILRYLNVQRVVIALTKIDLIPPTEQGAACQRVHQQLAGTIARDAYIFAVSSVTGVNLDLLKEFLRQQLVSLPPRDPDAPVYMPIDRVFTLAGRGTIVTGTLMQGRVAVGETVALAPLGESVRVRSLQVFGEARDIATGGTRVALNLPGVERERLARGAVVTDPSFSARSAFTVRFEALPEAQQLLRRRTPVRAYIGSAEVLGTLTFGDSVTLALNEPVLAFPGVRFVVRRLSPKTLLGGGEIVALGRESVATSAAPLNGAIAAALAQAQLEPQELGALAFAANVREDVAQAVLTTLVERGAAVALARPIAYVDAAAFAAFASNTLAELEAAHAREPWAVGVTSLALARALGIVEPLLVRLLGALVEEGRITQRHGYYATTAHQPKLTPEQRAFFEQHLPFDAASPFVPVSFDEVAASIKASGITGIGKGFDTLLARGVLIKVGDALYRGTQIEQAHQRVEQFITQHGKMTMAEFRDLLGTSRKYAVPLLEWFDGRGITVRSGDYRMLRRRNDRPKETS